MQTADGKIIRGPEDISFSLMMFYYTLKLLMQTRAQIGVHNENQVLTKPQFKKAFQRLQTIFEHTLMKSENLVLLNEMKKSNEWLSRSDVKKLRDGKRGAFRTCFHRFSGD